MYFPEISENLPVLRTARGHVTKELSMVPKWTNCEATFGNFCEGAAGIHRTEKPSNEKSLSKRCHWKGAISTELTNHSTGCVSSGRWYLPPAHPLPPPARKHRPSYSSPPADDHRDGLLTSVLFRVPDKTDTPVAGCCAD